MKGVYRLLGFAVFLVFLFSIFFMFHISPVFGAPATLDNIQPDSWTNFTTNESGEVLGVFVTNETSGEQVNNITWVFFNSTDDEVYAFVNTTSYTWSGDDSAIEWNLSVNINSSMLPEEIYHVAAISNRSGAGEAWSTANSTNIYIDYTVPTNIATISPTLVNNSNTSYNWFEINVTFTESNLDTCKLELNNGTATNYTMDKTANSTGGYCYYNATSQSNGHWNYTIFINDTTAGKLNVSSRYYINVDTTVPTITGFSCSPSSVYTGQIVTCSCSATDTISGIKTTSYNSKPSTLVSGTKTATCTATDYAGNSVSSSTSYTVKIWPSTEPAPERLPSMSRRWDKIEPGAAVSMNIDREGLDFTQIQLEVKNTANDVRLTVTKLSEQPATITQAVAGTVYHYIEIGKENINDTNIQTATIRFRVSNSWISENNINKNTIALNRYADGQWNKLTTTLVSEDADYTYYTAEVPGFSVFVITGGSAAQVCTPGAKQCSGNDLQECSSDGLEWTTSETCTYSCDATNLVCYSEQQPVCTAGTKRCVGDNLEQCSGDGMQWTVSETCTYGCDSTALACKSAPTDIWLYLAILVVIIVIIIGIVASKRL